MQRYHVPAQPRSILLMGLLLAAILSLAACGAVQDSATVPASVAIPTATIVIYGRKISPTPAPRPSVPNTRPPGFPTPDDPIARATRIAQHRADLGTQVALSPIPTLPPPTNPRTPDPTVTPWLGIGPAFNGAHFDPDRPIFVNAWRGVINGQYIMVGAGRQGDNVDPEQGVLMIAHGIDIDPQDPATEVYTTPQRIGEVHIVSTDGLLFNLAADPIHSTDIVFTFDLNTRQWVPPPTPGPSPVPTILPVPSVTP